MIYYALLLLLAFMFLMLMSVILALFLDKMFKLIDERGRNK